MANVLDWDFKVNEFELQSRYYIHFRTNTDGKGIDIIVEGKGIKWLNKTPIYKFINFTSLNYVKS